MDFQTIESLREILDFFGPDEKRHWEEAGKPDDLRRSPSFGQVFRLIKT